MAIDTAQTVREIAQQHPTAVFVFEARGIDYCRGGGKSLEDACKRRNIPLEEVMSDLAESAGCASYERRCPVDGFVSG